MSFYDLDPEDQDKLEALRTVEDAGGFWRLRVEETDNHRKYWEWRNDHWEYLVDIFGRVRPETYPGQIDKEAIRVLEQRVNYSPQIEESIQSTDQELQEKIESGFFDVQEPPVVLDDVVEKVDQLEVDLIMHLKRHHDDLLKIPPQVFEHLVAEFLASQGFADVRLVGKHSKTSADIYAAHIGPLGTQLRFFVEVKRWRDRVGIEVINQVAGAMLLERPAFGWHAAMVVALGGFKDFHRNSPSELSLRGIELKDRNDLLRWLEDYEPNEMGLWLPNPKTTL